MTAGGYFGRALIVDASTGTSETLELPEEILVTSIREHQKMLPVRRTHARPAINIR